MKLTKYDRQAIVRAIMNDVPKPDKTQRADKIQAAIVKAMSPDVRKVYNNVGVVFKGSGFYKTDSRGTQTSKPDSSASKSESAPAPKNDSKPTANG
jgi:predicted nucleic acid-binding Zn ribbon protein